MHVLFVAWLLATVVLAGCLSDGSDDAPRDDGVGALSWRDVGAMLYQPEHEHGVRDGHAEVARNTTVRAFGTLTDDGTSAGYYTEADVQGDLLAFAVITGPPPGHLDMRVILADRNALPELRVVGHFDEPGAYGDVKLDHGRPWAYVAYPGLRFGGPGSGASFAIWDVSDPASPQRVGQALGAGCHMLNTAVIAGEHYVWCVTVTGSMAYRIVDAGGVVAAVPVHPGNPQQDPEVLRYLDYYSSLTPLGPAVLLASHDMTVQDDPLTGTPLMVSAHEINGIRVFDVSRPEAAVEISRWVGDGLDAPLERVHTAALTQVGDRRIGLGATETYWDAKPALYVIDFTDWDDPVFLAEWNPPGIPDDAGGIYSTHNFQVVGDKVYLANFHAGVWAIDISRPEDPQAIALRTTVRDTGYPHPEDTGVDHNWIWDVLVVDGRVLTTDAPAGVEVLVFDGDPEGDVQYNGFL